MGSAAAGSLHVGVGADRTRLPEALLVLLRLEDRRPGTTPAGGGRRGSGGRPAAAPRLPLHRPRRRQLLSGAAVRPGDGRATLGPDAPGAAPPAARGTLRADGALGAAPG